jgi:hypothetical protein
MSGLTVMRHNKSSFFIGFTTLSGRETFYHFSSHDIAELLHRLDLLCYRANALSRGVKRYVGSPERRPALDCGLPRIRAADAAAHPCLDTKCTWVASLGFEIAAQPCQLIFDLLIGPTEWNPALPVFGSPSQDGVDATAKPDRDGSLYRQWIDPGVVHPVEFPGSFT